MLRQYKSPFLLQTRTTKHNSRYPQLAILQPYTLSIFHLHHLQPVNMFSPASLKLVCDSCRRRHTKCVNSGVPPCQRCVDNGKEDECTIDGAVSSLAGPPMTAAAPTPTASAPRRSLIVRLPVTLRTQIPAPTATAIQPQTKQAMEQGNRYVSHYLARSQSLITL